MIKTLNIINYLNKHDLWLTYANNGWIKWIYKDKFKNLEFELTDMTGIEDTKAKLVIMRENIDTEKSVTSRPEYSKRIVYYDNGKFKVTER